MPDTDSLYQELKPDVEELANALFTPAQMLVKKRGAFLPHGAVLNAARDVQLMMAAPDDPERDLVSSTEILPNLHEALRLSASQSGAAAVAVCEDVRIRQDGGQETRAIKVLVEHQRGLCVALYMPFRRRLFGYAFGDIQVTRAATEVNAWR